MTNRQVAKTLLSALIAFWALPLALGTWTMQGYDLRFTLYDAVILTIIFAWSAAETYLTVRKAFEAL